jgi:prepilin-type N-terminal cleavage/methylation domain-containing protein
MKIVNCKLKIAKRRGFTLVEMLVVVFVVGIGLVGALSFFNININNQFEAKNELIAAGLAQEGADLVRNLIDYGKMQDGADWTAIETWVRANCGSIDYRSLTGSPRTCQSGEYVCFSGGRYQQCASDPGNGMKRIVSYTYNAAERSLNIRVDVTWSGRKTTANDTIYGNNF